MATKRKTIEYGLQTVSTLLYPNTWRELSEIDIYIPESSVTFKSVILEWYFSTPSGSLMNDQYYAIDLGGIGWDQYNDTTNAITYSSEDESFLGTNIRDCTSYFTANWTGTSKTFKARFKTPNTLNPYFANIGAIVYITYEYDDTSPTQIKTVRVPIESRNASCVTENVWYSVGTNQIPKLTSGGLLPEASLNVRHMFLNLLGKDGLNAYVNSEMLARIDTGSASYLWYASSGSLTSLPMHCIYDVTSMDTTASHNLQVQSSAGSDDYLFNNIGGWLTVTYEFDPGATTTVLNSLMLPLPNEYHVQETSAADNLVSEHNFYIPEPGAITLKQSAVVFQINDEKDMALATGSQTPVTWDLTFEIASESAGPETIVHRIDSGGAASSDGITLTNGENSLLFKAHDPASYWSAGNWRAFALLNYTSGKSDQGVGAHSHPVLYLISPQVDAVYSTRRNYTTLIDITESNYLINGAMLLYKSQSSAYDNAHLEMLIEYKAGEGPGSGWATALNVSDAAQNTENQMVVYSGYLDNVFSPYPNCPDSNLVDIETSRVWRINLYGPGFGTITSWINYSSITYGISGSVFGYTGDGSGISVQIYRASDHKHILDATTSAGGGYSATWYDGNDDIYAAARQDSTHVGRSDNGAAV